MNYEISVVIPVYNGELYIKRCLDSVLNQTYTSFEVIVVNDGSTDATKDILNEYASVDKRIKVINKENGGHASARNTGIDVACKSQSKWITFIDVDDWIDKYYLEYLLKSAKENNVRISVCGYERVYSVDNQTVIGEYKSKVYTPEDLWCEKRINATIPCGKLYDIEFFTDGTRWPNKVHDDEHMTYKLLFSCEQVTFIDLSLYKYYFNENSVMASSWSPRRIDSVYAIKERREYFRENNFLKALELDNKLYIEELYNTLCNVAKIKKDYKKEYNFLKKELKRELKKNGELLGYGKKDAPYMWLAVFPLFKLTYICKSKIKKIFKRVNNG